MYNSHFAWFGELLDYYHVNHSLYLCLFSIIFSVVQVSTGVYQRLVFEASTGKQVTSSDVINKITWASWTR